MTLPLISWRCWHRDISNLFHRFSSNFQTRNLILTLNLSNLAQPRPPASNFSQKVSECESIIAYEFTSKTLCAEALNKAADWNCQIVINGSAKWMPKNDRLAVYGDSAVAFYLCNLWIKRGLSNHCWTTIRGDLISNSNLTEIRKERGLDKCINMNGGSRSPSPSMVATAVEAILGAV
ncbi:hypothetical protein FVER53590_12282 [Fusarium verticillioides]|nr:hypothetical protein FVER53590_12282 [Fusarium verticillioides]